jgi:preprotein translocase subunit SecE
MSTDEKLDTQPKRRRWRRGQAEEETQAELENTEVGEDDDEEVDSRGITAKKGRATPSRRDRERTAEVEETGNVVTRPVNRVSEYLTGVRTELGKVTWPTRQETIRLTTIVLTTTIVSALVLGIVTLLFTELFRIGVSQPLVFLGVFLVVLAGVAFYVRRSNSQRTTSY